MNKGMCKWVRLSKYMCPFQVSPTLLKMPFGKGAISNMKDSAPKIWNYLNTKLAEIGIDNTGDIPVSTQPSTSIEESFFKDFIIRFNENHPEFRNLEVPKL